VTRRDCVTMSAEREAASGRGNRGNDTSRADTNLIGPKIKKFTWSIQLLEMDDENLKQ
jgi:hypothetical protein